MRVEKGQAYSAQLSLGFFDGMASNERVADEFRKVGFSDVTVTGTGAMREAVGTWSGETREVELPTQVVDGSVKKVA